MPAHHHRAAPAAVGRFIDRDRISKLLARWVPDEKDRAFVARCLLDEGPAHHRGANFVLLALLGELLDRTGAAKLPEGPLVEVPMHLPPHLKAAVSDGAFPLRFPRRVLERLAAHDSPELAAMIDCVIDGPPQHALANATMLCALAALLEASTGGQAPR
jgi:hypothetical protein